MSETNGRPGGHTYPCASLDEALPELRHPPAPEAVRFKLTPTNRENTSGQVAAYVDARLVFTGSTSCAVATGTPASSP
jgi:hypothetical protein